MTKNTLNSFRNLVIYEIYVRNHSPQGNFRGVADDLERIKDLGVDVVWLMPIHPIGLVGRKGRLGSPYSIADYFSVNPEYGSEQDFIDLVQKAHRLDLKLMIDVVYNHTSHDALLLHDHPEWYHTDSDSKPCSTVPEWSDVLDLDFKHPELYQYLISALEKWARLGVDGFRCDVASVVPLDFWLKARSAIEKINPELIWLAESVEADWINIRRRCGLYASSDSELYQAFDITYDYDISNAWKKTVQGALETSIYIDLLRFQEAIYPQNYIKLHFTENHDLLRIMSFAQTRSQALAWTALQAFNKGAWLIYAGQEAGCRATPSMFEKDPIQWGNYELFDFTKKLASIKKDQSVQHGNLIWTKAESAVVGVWYTPQACLVGIFNVRGQQGELQADLPDGAYVDMLSTEKITVKNGRLTIPESAVIFSCELNQEPQAYPAKLI